jgi:hypothetical protein
MKKYNLKIIKISLNEFVSDESIITPYEYKRIDNILMKLGVNEDDLDLIEITTTPEDFKKMLTMVINSR